MKCIRAGCTVELTGRQRQFCSDKCRKAVSRTNKTHEDCAGEPNADKSDTIHPLKSDIPKQYAREHGFDLATCSDSRLEQSHAAARVLPSDIPEPISSRYARGEPKYNKMIDMLITTPLAQLKADGVWIPVWRLNRKDAA